MDAWIHDNVRLMLPAFSVPFSQGGLHEFVLAKAQMSENTEFYLAFFELLPALIRDSRHGKRVTDVYEWAIQMYLKLFAPVLADMDEREARGFVQLLIAVVDGLGVQHCINSESFQPETAFAMLESVLTTWVRARGHSRAVVTVAEPDASS